MHNFWCIIILIEYIDLQVGEIIEELKSLDIYDNTIIIISSDNGPTYAGGVDYEYFNSTWNQN